MIGTYDVLLFSSRNSIMMLCHRECLSEYIYLLQGCLHIQWGYCRCCEQFISGMQDIVGVSDIALQSGSAGVVSSPEWMIIVCIRVTIIELLKINLHMERSLQFLRPKLILLYTLHQHRWMVCCRITWVHILMDCCWCILWSCPYSYETLEQYLWSEQQITLKFMCAF